MTSDSGSSGSGRSGGRDSRSGRSGGSGKGALTALHLLLVWATMTAAVPALGFGVVVAAWGGGAAPVFVVGVPLTLGLLVLAGLPARNVVPLCGSGPKRVGWAVLVFVLGTIGVAAGLAAYTGDVDLGSAGTRIVLTGVPYAVAAAFFVPGRWVRPGALVVLAAAVAYGGFVGPARAERRQDEAEVARYREHQELLYLGDAPAGMRVSRAQVGPAGFGVEYRPVREGYEPGYAGLVVRRAITPGLRCPEILAKGTTCAVGADGVMMLIDELSGGARDVTLVCRLRDVEVTVDSQSVDESGLRRLLATLHPLSDAELDQLRQDKAITLS
ncbi:hypothetical protein ACFVQ4_13290 [Streptomyces laurentii]|uniref:hypothetical protein n=1 Tax=Streptomyces laurentii TaxID=39478 RepID=UPI003698DAC8